MKESDFEKKNKEKIFQMSKDKILRKYSMLWIKKALEYEYSYHFKWLGRPVIQFPQDILAIQELIWKIKPDLVIETGIARGGLSIFVASLLSMIGKGKLLGIEIDFRSENKKAMENHPLYKQIKIIEGSSVDDKIIKKAYRFAKRKERVLVLLDSNHTHSHVLQELISYSPLVKKGSYVVVFDTFVEDMPLNFIKNRPWNKNNNPKTAIREFLKNNNRFVIDKEFENKLIITGCPDGFLKCVK